MKPYHRKINALVRKQGEAKGLWTSLEIAKLVVATLTPLTIFALGAYITATNNRASSERAEAAQRAQLADVRLQIGYQRRQQAWQVIAGPVSDADVLDDGYCDEDIECVRARDKKLDLYEDARQKFLHSSYLFRPKFKTAFLDFIHMKRGCSIQLIGTSVPMTSLRDGTFERESEERSKETAACNRLNEQFYVLLADELGVVEGTSQSEVANAALGLACYDGPNYVLEERQENSRMSKLCRR